MLGKTANGLFWMFRYLERSENTARLIHAGLRMALTRSQNDARDWESILTTGGILNSFKDNHEVCDGKTVMNFLLRDTNNFSSVLSSMEQARQNARLARTALTREVWEAVNESWLALSEALKKPAAPKDIPDILSLILRQSAQVQGALHSTMLRNDIFDFSRLGTFIERADNTSRIIDVKYYVLLPSSASVGGPVDNAQWEGVLRSVSAQQSYRWLHQGELSAKEIANFLILDRRMPRSLLFCLNEIVLNLNYLDKAYSQKVPSTALARRLKRDLAETSIEEILENGLHEFIADFLNRNRALAAQIETDFRFMA